ncbi:MAG: hypothetical protein JRJ18_16995 [Deltaproteobacteria bacterium]|nr:hypothetical protein [Deltaproteobacteria bacterium]
MGEERQPNPNIVHHIATGYMGTCVLLAALELDVFDELSKKPMNSQQLADALGLSVKPLERLLVALTALGLLVRRDGIYSCSPETDRYLVKSSPSYFGDYYRFEVRHCLMPDFIRLDELIKENRAVMADDWSEFMADEEKARVFSLGQHSASMGGGRTLAAKFDFSPFKKLVDLAGGTGACSIAACRTNPELKSVVVDFPNVLKVAEEVIAREGLSDRISTQAGDISKDDWPEGDVMLISLVISGFGKEDQLRIFRKCHEKLPSGGAVIVHDFLLNEDYTGPVLSGLYYLISVDGVPTSAKDMAGLLQEAGFVEPVIRTVIPEYTAMVCVTKP